MPIFRSVKSAIERSKLVFLTMDGQTIRDNKWSDKKALTTPKVEPSKIPIYRHKKETEEQGITAPEFYKRLHRMAAEWGVN
jgi:hypothetical protein